MKEKLQRLALDDCKQNDDDEEEESQIKEDAISFIRITIWSANLITCSQYRTCDKQLKYKLF